MNVVTYQIHLLEPLLATRLAGDPNSSLSFAYAPGSLIRGAVIRAHRQATSFAFDAADERNQRLYFSGATRFLHAYPLTGRQSRALPLPLTWYNLKGEESRIYDFAVEAADSAGEYAPEPQRAPPQYVRTAKHDRRFCLLEGTSVEMIEPVFQVNAHTARDRVMGRAYKRAGAEQQFGAVFQYQALAAGTELTGAVLAQTAEDAAWLRQLLAGVHFLGGSSNAGYGRVAVEVARADQAARQPWREIAQLTGTIAPGTSFTVTLTSDALVRDAVTGQPTADIAPALASLLATAVTPAPVVDDQVERRSIFQMNSVGGFNQHWGLPLPQVQALAAGSVFVFTADRALTADELRQAEWRGLGERRAEGFGSFVFNLNEEPEFTLRRARTPAAESPVPVLSGASERMAAQVVERLLRRDLDAALVQRVNRMTMANMPSKHQLARFRTVVRNALPDRDVERLRGVLDSIKQRRTARDQFERARIDKQAFDLWLGAHLANPALVWDDLGAANYRYQLGANVVRTALGDAELAREYTMRLIDAVLAMAARRSTQED